MLGVDTEVVARRAAARQGGRPRRGAADALEALSGRTHTVLERRRPARRLDAAAGEPARALGRGSLRGDVPGARPRSIVERYLASGEWRDRAGAYAIQGLGSMLVERVEGDFSNVVGLPIRAAARQLAPELFAAAGGSAPEADSDANP